MEISSYELETRSIQIATDISNFYILQRKDGTIEQYPVIELKKIIFNKLKTLELMSKTKEIK